MKYSSIRKALAVRADHAENLQNPTSYSNSALAVYLYCCRRSTARLAKTECCPTKTCEDVTDSNLQHTITMHRLANRLARVSTNPTWRGLEFHSINMVRLERAKRRQCIRQAILAVQEQHRQQQCDSETCPSKNNISLEERLRWISEQGSTATTLFAQVLGLADALAAQEYYQQEQPECDTGETVPLPPSRKRRRSQLTTLETPAASRVCEAHVRIPFSDAPSSINVELSPVIPPAMAVKVL